MFISRRRAARRGHCPTSAYDSLKGVQPPRPVSVFGVWPKSRANDPDRGPPRPANLKREVRGVEEQLDARARARTGRPAVFCCFFFLFFKKLTWRFRQRSLRHSEKMVQEYVRGSCRLPVAHVFLPGTKSWFWEAEESVSVSASLHASFSRRRGFFFHLFGCLSLEILQWRVSRLHGCVAAASVMRARGKRSSHSGERFLHLTFA
jgi:hypothetical protein